MRSGSTFLGILLVVLAGCSDPPAAEEDPAPPVPNKGFSSDDVDLDLDDCIGTHLVVDVERGRTQERMPEGYEADSGPMARASLTTLDCGAAAFDGADLGHVGLGWAQVFLDTAGGQPAPDGGYLFELVTDSPGLAEGLRALGWTVLDGTFGATDTSIAMAAAGIQYEATFASLAPIGFTYTANFHQVGADGVARVVDLEDTGLSANAGAGTLVATEGILADLATPPGAPHAAQLADRFTGGFRFAFQPPAP